MTTGSIAATAALIAATALLAIVVRRLGRETDLGLLHPAALWAAFTVLFFALGSLVLATAGRPGPAAYTAGAMVAVACGLGASAWIARERRSGPTSRALTTAMPDEIPWTGTIAEAGPALRGGDGMDGRNPVLAGLRVPIVVSLAGIGLLAIAPTLWRTGLPFLVPDITGARVELAGLPIQLSRVALPALSAVALLVALRSPSVGRLALAGAVILVIGAFDVLLASRYLVAELVVVLVLTWCLSGRRIPPAVVLGGAIGAIALFAGIQVLRTWDQAVGEPLAFALTRTIDRVLLIGPRTLDALMTVIPAEQDHFGGLTWVRRLAPILGRDDVPNIGYWIFPRVIPGGDGYAAPGWLGEAWANLGWAGMTLFLLLGVAMERLGALIERRRREAADIVAAACIVLFIARTHALGVVGLGVLAVLVVVWRLASGPADGLLRDVVAIVRWRPIPSAVRATRS